MSSFGPRPPREILAYTAVLADRLLRVRDAGVVAVYLHGSASLGGWQARVSDVDVLVVVADDPVADDPDPVAVGALTDAVVATVPDCPGTGLELSVVTRGEAAAPRPPWRFVVHVAGGDEGGDGRPGVVRGEGHPGDPDLLLHYAVCRAAGWPVVGPPPAEAVGPVGRPAVLAALADELAWGLEHAAAAYALLNACRAPVYLREGRLVAKVAGGRWALERGVGPVEGVRRALAAQAGGAPVGKSIAGLADADVDFIRRTARLLSAAAGDGRVPAEQPASR